MFKVFANVYHSDSKSEHIERFYMDLDDAYSCIELLSLVFNTMKKAGSVAFYDIRLICGCNEDE